MKEVSSSSASLLGCERATVNIVNSSNQARADGSRGPSSPHCDQTEDFDESSSWVLDHIIFFCKRLGLAIEGKEMKLLSCLTSLDAFGNKENQLKKRAGFMRWGKNIV